MVFILAVRIAGTQPMSEQQLYMMGSNNVFAVNAGYLAIVFTFGIATKDEKEHMEAAKSATVITFAVNLLILNVLNEGRGILNVFNINRNQPSWPPDEWAEIYDKYREHSSWYSGNPIQLADYYATKVYSPTKKGTFWSQHAREEVSTRLHIPVATNLASTSASLLFGKPIIPTISSNPASQDRLLQLIASGDMNSTLSEAAEYCSALGGVFLKINWDSTISPNPILNIGQPDQSIMDFKHGMLTSVTFHKEVIVDGSVVYRLLERHDSGLITNSLYRGSETKLGSPVALTFLPQTQDLPEVIETGLTTLACRYIPNIRPNRLFRGSNLGVSDYAGIEGLMDALDEVYSSWMNDLGLSRSRIIVPQDWLLPTTNGNYFDINQSVYSPLDMDPEAAAAFKPEMFQAAIRASEHQQTALELLDRIVTHSGYSPSTYGLKIEGRSESGTALNIRERTTLATREKKIGYWRSNLEDIFYILQQVDYLQLGNKAYPVRPTIEFPAYQEDDDSLIAAVKSLAESKSASLTTRLKLLHPSWSQAEIEAETLLIQAEITN
ncbi:MAG: hypothetical protein CVU90_01980 [Firmicutes bacterium HGW-Firmicutes-15]|nr:MAG: hypothetical protein CVU90_01980 [Firmicutes bacterium HGW-Firmicutes-15]